MALEGVADLSWGSGTGGCGRLDTYCTYIFCLKCLLRSNDIYILFTNVGNTSTMNEVCGCGCVCGCV